MENELTLPDGIQRRCLNRKQAALYLNISANTLTRMVNDGEGPKPIQISKRRVLWDIKTLDEYIESLKGF